MVQPSGRCSDKKLADFALSKGTAGFKASELAGHLSISKKAARQRIKYARKAGIVITDGRTNPQRYYHASLIADVKKARYDRNVPFDGTVVQGRDQAAVTTASSKAELAERQRILDAVNYYKIDSILQSLQGSIWKLHNLQYEVFLDSGYNLAEFPFADQGWQKSGKGSWNVTTSAGGHPVKFIVHPEAGKALIYPELSRTPLAMATWEDYDAYNQWLGSVAQQLRNYLADSHCRLVPPIREWHKIRSDMNCDIPVPHVLHLLGPKLQVKYDNYIMRIYVKSLGDQTVLRVEKSEWQNQRPLDHAAEVLTLNGLEHRVTRLENRQAEMAAAVDKIGLQVAELERRWPHPH